MITIVSLGLPAATRTPATAAYATGRAHIAHALNVTDTAHLRYIRNSGSLLIEEGSVTGALPGTMHATMDIAATTSGDFTLYTHSGSISGHGSGVLHGTGRYASFGGTMSVTHGTGEYAHAQGHGGFYGVFERQPPYRLTVQTTGTLDY